MKLLILLLFVTINLPAQVRYKQQTTDLAKKVTQVDVTAIWIQHLKTIDSLKTVNAEFKAGNRIDTLWFSKIPDPEIWGELAKGKYYTIDSAKDFTKVKMTVTVEYKVGDKRRTFKFIDNE